MNIIVVDDEQWALDSFRIESRTIPEYQDAKMFSSSRLALEHAREHPVDFAILDIQMPVIDGLTLAKELKLLLPTIVIIFLTSHQKYMPDFIAIKADYFVMKPCNCDDLLDALHRAKRLSQPVEESKPIKVETFGQFDVYFNGNALAFCGKKVKELFALFVDKRGGVLHTEEAFFNLYEDKEYSNKNAVAYRKLMKRLEDYLEEVGIGDILINDHGQRRLDCKKIECDLIAFLEGDVQAMDHFGGFYMTDYSWAEVTLGSLCQKKEEYLSLNNTK